MRLLIDCDILLDVALHRQPHFEESVAILDWAEKHPGRGAFAWHSVGNINYLAGKNSRKFIVEIIQFLEVPPTATQAVHFALNSGMKDFEDAMQVAAAELFGAQMIVTRNVRDYRKSPIRAATPKEILPLLRL